MYVTRRLLRSTVDDAKAEHPVDEMETTTLDPTSPKKKRRPLEHANKSKTTTTSTRRPASTRVDDDASKPNPETKPTKSKTQPPGALQENDGDNRNKKVGQSQRAGAMEEAERGRGPLPGMGLLVDARDAQARWAEAKILDLDITKKAVFVHYVGWNARYDTWVEVGCLAAHGSHTGATRRASQSWNGKSSLFGDTPAASRKKEAAPHLSPKANGDNGSTKKRRSSEKEISTSPANKRARGSTKATTPKAPEIVKVEVGTVDEESERRSRRQQKVKVDLELEMDVRSVPKASPSSRSASKRATATATAASSEGHTSETNKRARTRHDKTPTAVDVTTAKKKPTTVSNKRASPRAAAVAESAKKQATEEENEAKPVPTVSVTEPVSVILRRTTRTAATKKPTKKKKKGRGGDDDDDDSDEEYVDEADEEEEDEEEEDEDEEEEDEALEDLSEDERPRKRATSGKGKRSGSATSSRPAPRPLDPATRETRERLAAIFRLRLQQRAQFGSFQQQMLHVPTQRTSKATTAKGKKKNGKAKKKTAAVSSDDDEEESPDEAALQAYYAQQQYMQAYQYQQYYYHQAMLAAQYQQQLQQQQLEQQQHSPTKQDKNDEETKATDTEESSMMENGRIIQARMDALEQQRRLHAELYYQHQMMARERNLQMLASSQEFLERSGSTWRQQANASQETPEEDETETPDKQEDVDDASSCSSKETAHNEDDKPTACPAEKDKDDEARPSSSTTEDNPTASLPSLPPTETCKDSKPTEGVLYECVL